MFPVTHLTEWEFMQNLRKCRSVLPHSSDLVWTSPTKKESTLNKNSILWSHLWQRSLQTKCTILCSFSSLTSWMTTGQPDRRPPRRDPPCNCCPKPCQQFLLSQRYGPQNLSIFVVVFYITFRFFNGKLWCLDCTASARSLISIFLFRIYKCISTERFSRGPRKKCFQIPSTLLWILGECEGE